MVFRGTLNLSLGNGWGDVLIEILKGQHTLSGLFLLG